MQSYTHLKFWSGLRMFPHIVESKNRRPVSDDGITILDEDEEEFIFSVLWICGMLNPRELWSSNIMKHLKLLHLNISKQNI